MKKIFMGEKLQQQQMKQKVKALRERNMEAEKGRSKKSWTTCWGFSCETDKVKRQDYDDDDKTLYFIRFTFFLCQVERKKKSI